MTSHLPTRTRQHRILITRACNTSHLSTTSHSVLSRHVVGREAGFDSNQSGKTTRQRTPLLARRHGGTDTAKHITFSAITTTSLHQRLTPTAIKPTICPLPARRRCLVEQRYPLLSAASLESCLFVASARAGHPHEQSNTPTSSSCGALEQSSRPWEKDSYATNIPQIIQARGSPIRRNEGVYSLR